MTARLLLALVLAGVVGFTTADRCWWGPCFPVHPPTVTPVTYNER